MKKFRLYLFVFALLPCCGIAQNPTLSPKDKPERDNPALHKVLLVPFEPKLYMSEIDRYINLETKLNAKEIKHKFRDGINEQLFKALKGAKFNCLDLMEDTTKHRKELENIYHFLGYNYLKVPDQLHYKVPQKEKETKKIEKGQLVVETNSDQRFMDASISNPKLFTQLQGKYKTDLFIFVNQLDLKASGSKDPTDPGPESEFRKIVVHYTIFNAAGAEINSGIVEENFDPALNNPKKIIDKHFAKVAAVLVQRLQKTLVQPH